MSELPTIPLGPIQCPRSITPGAVPTPEIAAEGQLLANLPDKAIFTKDEHGDIIVLARNYDDVLMQHFNASNPHGMTAADLELDKVPNIDLRPVYMVNPPTATLNQNALLTRIDRWGIEDVVYTIQNDEYTIGDTIEVIRCDDGTGQITIEMDITNEFFIRGEVSSDILVMSGGTPFKTVLRKISSTTWIVFVERI